MANMWFSVIVLIFVQNVLAYECPVTSQKILNCDQCMRCGGNWCSQPKNMDKHCSYLVTDDWCDKRETPTQIESSQRAGQTVEPVYAERSLIVDRPDTLPFSYNSPVERRVSHYIHNTTQNFDYIDVSFETGKCDGGKCKLYIVTKVNAGFCGSRSSDMEFLYVTIKVGNSTEEAVIKYHVPCACACSKIVEKQAQQCSGNGDFSCGVCACYEGWSGKRCEKTECEKGRMDIQCVNPLKDNVACSGNGYCGPCDTCVCYTNMTGAQYFDRAEYCSDVCMETGGCERCLTGARLGPCDPTAHEAECTHHMTMLKYDEALAAERDDMDRLEWVTCNNTFRDPDCYVEYLAMKTESGISIMVVKSCNDHGSGAITDTTETKVPIVLGVLGVLAVVAAVGGVLLWKHLHAVPPMPFSSPDYQNIDAEDCVGENPLYKSPTSTFTNPQFGKC